MSGIGGVIQWDGAPVAPAALQAMAHAAAHRGPDGCHSWRQGPVGLLHLAHHLLPEDPLAPQPLVSEPEPLVLSAAVRLDNRDELIPLLRARGCLPQPQPSDAELILAAYRCWGLECPARLLGDFAFALWDGQQQRLLAARDPMGMRPFYYRAEGRRFLFGSEVKQILAAPDVPVRLFEPAVGAHLAGIFGPLEWTFYEGIAQLAPAHALLVEAGKQRAWRYWDIDPEARVRFRDEREYAEAFREQFAQAVRCRLRSRKPVGLFLSGGMDSGSIAATAGWLGQREGLGTPAFRAYCWAFEQLPECDERHISGPLAAHYGIPTVDVAADEAWPLKDYPAHGPDRDEPLIGVYQALLEQTLTAARSDGVGLMLSGDRGDELVGDWIFDCLGLLGSGRWRQLGQELRAYRGWAGVSTTTAVQRLLIQPMQSSFSPPGRSGWLRQAVSAGHGDPAVETRYPDWIDRKFAERIDLCDIATQTRPKTPMRSYARRERYERIFTVAGIRTAVKSERSWARYGLEFADPWSDRRLASFVLAVPQRMVQRVQEPKRLAREAMRGVMPEPVRRTAGKTIPGSLFDRGFKERSRKTIRGLVTESRSGEFGFTDEPALRNCYEAYLQGQMPRHDFWWPLTLEIWLRQYWC